MLPLRKHWAIAERFNVEILRVVELGFVKKWFKDAKKFLNTHKERSPEDVNVAFGLGDLYPVFLIWIFGICLSGCAFAAEIFVNRFA